MQFNRFFTKILKLDSVFMQIHTHCENGNTLIVLIVPANKICSPTYQGNELKIVKDYATWNGFPKKVI